MKLKAFLYGDLAGGLLTAPLIALAYLASQLADLPFPPFDLFNWISGILPGPVITFGIDLMIDTLLLLGISVANTAKIAEQAMAVILFLVLGIITGGIFFLIFEIRRTKVDRVTGLVVGALFGLPIAVISVVTGASSVYPVVSFVWLLLLVLIWGLGLAWSYQQLFPIAAPAPEEPADITGVQRLNRRQFLILLGGSAATITVIGTGLGAVLASADRRREQAAQDETSAHNTESTDESSFPNSNDPVVPAPGTRPEYTPLKDFYKVFIELEPTVIDGATWMLPITGMVASPLMLTLDDLRNDYPSRDQYATLSCISGRVGTTLISTTQWTGVSLQDILAEAQVQDGARYLVISSGDGFYETVDLDLIASDERIMLCYNWDGNPIPVDHGYPLRIWIPDRYGMKQPKWITSMEVVADYEEGYWVKRGWDEVAQVKATSVVDTVAVDAVYDNGAQRLVPVGGIAFAGARGISSVEVRVDEGSWQPAQLRSPLSETTWVIWRYDWPFEAGDHTFEVRCKETDGTPQIEEETDSRPSGATGIDSRKATLI
jgi:DMSO/TMAO reductase YedYZ molybdopterin-dependent catalytic subunit